MKKQFYLRLLRTIMTIYIGVSLYLLSAVLHVIDYPAIELWNVLLGIHVLCMAAAMFCIGPLERIEKEEALKANEDTP